MGDVDDVPPVQDFDNEAVWNITAHDASYTIGLLVRRGLLDDPDEGTRRLQP